MEHYHAKRLYIGTTAERTTLGGTFGTESIGVRFWDTDTGEEYVWSGAAWIASPAHNLLSATHTDTVVNAPTRGSLVYGDATPDWDELVLGADGAALISDGTDMAWDLTPTWKGVHTHEANIVLDDGVSDSPIIQFIGGSNDDVAQIYLDDDGAAGRSDLIVQLCDDAGESKLYLKNLSGNPVWTVDSDGNVVMADGTTIGQAAGPLLTFDDTNNYLEIMGCDVGVGTTTPSWFVSAVNTVLQVAYDGDGFPVIALERYNAVAKTDRKWSMYVGSTGNFAFIDETGGSAVFEIEKDAPTASFVIKATTGRIGFGTTIPAGQLEVDQANAAGAVPPLVLDQADVDQDMIEFQCTIGVGNAIEAVGGKTLTTTHFIKVTLPGLTRYIPVGTIA